MKNSQGVTIITIIISKGLIKGREALEISGQVEIIQISKNTEKSPGDMRRLALT